MPQSLLIGVPTVLAQNVPYALPARLVSVTTSKPCDTSTDMVNWTSFISGTETSANFIICSNNVATVTCKAASLAGGGGSGIALPTAPIGQVLISQGDGVPPVFSNIISLINPNAMVDSRNWKISVENGGDLMFKIYADNGLPRLPRVSADPYSGGWASSYGGMNAGSGLIGAKFFGFGPNLFSELPPYSPVGTPGNMANVTDSNKGLPDEIITAGGGSFNVLARWNGTNWKVIQ